MQRRDALKLLSLPAVAPAARLIPGWPGWQDPPAAPRPMATPDVELTLRAAAAEVPLVPGAPTRVWRYTGAVLRGPSTTIQSIDSSYLGPTIRLRRGQRVRVRLFNELLEPTIVHWHGLDVPESADGHPRLAIDPGGEYVYDFVVDNRAGTYWYHPHPHMRTAAQVYMGLAGLLVVDDQEEDALRLPSEEAELHCVLQDRSFDARNQFAYPSMDMDARGRGMGRGRGGSMMAMMALENGVLGDRVLVNGRLDHAATVEAGWIRVRLLNGSNARIYNLAWTGDRPMIVIGTDGGLLERPAPRVVLTLGPGQRADVLLDLSDLGEGSSIALRSRAFPAAETGSVGMMASSGGAPSGAALEVMTLHIRGRNTRAFRLPERLSTFGPLWASAPEAPVRRVPLSFVRMEWQIDGRVFGMTDVAASETVRAGSTQVWEFVNVSNPMGMSMAHPMHLHGRQFRVIQRSGASPTSALGAGLVDAGWTDTVLVRPGETVRVQVTFTEHRGLFLYHCHILEHEDLGMMRNFRVI